MASRAVTEDFSFTDPTNSLLRMEAALSLLEAFSGNEIPRKVYLLAVAGEFASTLAADLLAPTELGSVEVTCDIIKQTLLDHLSSQRLEIANVRRSTQLYNDLMRRLLYSRLKSLAQHCNFGDSLQIMLRDRMVLGCSSSEARQHLLKKDPLTFIRAAALALKTERKLHFLIVGDGELKDDCIKETRRLGIENNVSFQNIEADVPYILKIFDIYCMPSQWEGLSIGLLEAMAMRKAIITSPLSANLEVIADRTDGMLVSAVNPEEWKEAIIELQRNPELREKMGQQARMFVERYSDIRNSVSSHATLYRRLVMRPQDNNEEDQPEKILYSI